MSNNILSTEEEKLQNIIDDLKKENNILKNFILLSEESIEQRDKLIDSLNNENNELRKNKREFILYKKIINNLEKENELLQKLIDAKDKLILKLAEKLDKYQVCPGYYRDIHFCILQQQGKIEYLNECYVAKKDKLKCWIEYVKSEVNK